ncbi:ComEC/Rec2 family competence protein [Solirubrobacter soli]|uniref:ComEC/Rec2 family competence protein n=1 Tax=Solirubrobacter soli TaxID=363832 RepID=UPI00040D6667|nr:ComEC/Rec2 family competence protein [Solirubrobacter soli]
MRRAVAALRAHPRHVILAAVVAGLLTATIGDAAVLAAAALATVLLASPVRPDTAPGRHGPGAENASHHVAAAPFVGAAHPPGATRPPAAPQPPGAPHPPGVAARRAHASPLLLALTLVALVAGACFTHARLDALDAGVLETSTGHAIDGRAVVLEPVRERKVGPTVARVRLLDGVGAKEQAVLRFQRTMRPWPEVGDIVAVRGTVAPLGFADAYQRRRNAHAAIAATQVDKTGTRRGGIAGTLDTVRRRAEHGLAQGLAPPEAALLRGMVLGEDERLADDVRDDFQNSGLAHILAVSGQNVVLLIVLVLAACALFGVPLRARLLLATAVVALYVPLAGGGPSIQRAGVMGVAGLVAALAGRPAQRWYALLLAAAATLTLNPRTAGEPGWQLSFAAVIALLLGATPLKRTLARRMPDPLAEATAITVAATAGTAPLMALHFQQLSLASLPANLLAAPAIAPVMWLGVLAAAAAQLAPALALPFTTLTAPLLVYLQQVAHHTAATPISTIELHASPAAIAVATAALLAATATATRMVRRARARGTTWPAGANTRGAAPGRRARRLAVAAAAAAATAGAIVVAATLHGAQAAPRPGELVVSFLDVGQGDATLIQLGATAVLVDTGPPDGPILKRLREARVKRLDALFLTHAEADHEGAAPQVITNYKPRMIVDGGAGWESPVQRALRTTPTIPPRAGQRIDVGDLRFQILWPTRDDEHEGNPNDHAIVARLTHGQFSLLLTADAESNVTNPLNLQPVDVLKVAHHGSADPGLPQLLERIKPRVAAIEVGRHNRYGHPAPTTLKALQHVPTVIRTDQDGTVRLRVDHDRITVQR